MWYVCDVMYAVLYVCVSFFLEGVDVLSRGCVLMFAIMMCLVRVVNVYLDHLKFCVVCINGRRYVCCRECIVVSNECDEPTPCLVQSVGAHGGEIMFWECLL